MPKSSKDAKNTKAGNFAQTFALFAVRTFYEFEAPANGVIVTFRNG
jgi:hypothetical protein